ncbi:MAG: hypothetical protein EU529_04395 [Promethearchaeota archaeon]|nr:MAG: hypothetical protein EU529_04395 [Candidatus Lokiarchaeota archaeon]
MNKYDEDEDENKEFNEKYVYTDGEYHLVVDDYLEDDEFWDEPNEPLSKEEEERSMIETFAFCEEQRKKEREREFTMSKELNPKELNSKVEVIKAIQSGKLGYFVWGTISPTSKGIQITLDPSYNNNPQELFKDGIISERTLYKIIFKKAINECPRLREDTEQTN